MQPQASDGVAQWLAWLETLNPREIDLGLERVGLVAARLGLLDLGVPVITVAGTNGKGSVCAMLEAVIRAEGAYPGVYTSPHLYRYHERVRIGGREVDDETLLAGLREVERVRADIPLTFFEYTTLAALNCLRNAGANPVILETGLGGRLDATNVIDSSVAVITSIGVDHVEWLGTDRAGIAREKAGIARAGRPLIVGETDLPANWPDTVQASGAREIRRGRDFDFRIERGGGQWRFEYGDWGHGRLPLPTLAGEWQVGNAATAIATLTALRGNLPTHNALATGLCNVNIPGRLERIVCRDRELDVFLDVGHNPQAASALARALAAAGEAGRTHCIIGMYQDKDVAGVVAALAPVVDDWFCATLPPPRGLTGAALAQEVAATAERADRARDCDSLNAALANALAQATPGDRLLITGSFATVAQLRGHFL